MVSHFSKPFSRAFRILQLLVVSQSFKPFLGICASTVLFKAVLVAIRTFSNSFAGVRAGVTGRMKYRRDQPTATGV